MAEFTVHISIKKLFFNSERVKRAFDKRTRQKLRHIGGLIRKIARGSIRRVPDREKHAPPGHPPYSHIPADAGFQGIKHILYGADIERRSVIIGPVGRRRFGSTVPEILEFGGSIKRRRIRFKIGQKGPIAVRGGKLVYVTLRTAAQVQRAQQLAERKWPLRARIAPRPFMGPALTKALPSLPKCWANSVRP